MSEGTDRQFAPGVAEAFEAQGHDLSTEPQAGRPSTVAIPKASIRYLAGGKKARFAEVELDTPVEVDGKPFYKIGVRRLNVKEVGEYFDALAELRKTDPDTPLPFPLFIDEAGDPLPPGLLEALTDDDSTRLGEVSEDFLPQRFRVRTDPGAGDSDTLNPSAGDRPARNRPRRRVVARRHQFDGLA